MFKVKSVKIIYNRILKYFYTNIKNLKTSENFVNFFSLGLWSSTIFVALPLISIIINTKETYGPGFSYVVGLFQITISWLLYPVIVFTVLRFSLFISKIFLEITVLKKSFALNNFKNNFKYGFFLALKYLLTLAIFVLFIYLTYSGFFDKISENTIKEAYYNNKNLHLDYPQSLLVYYLFNPIVLFSLLALAQDIIRVILALFKKRNFLLLQILSFLVGFGFSFYVFVCLGYLENQYLIFDGQWESMISAIVSPNLIYWFNLVTIITSILLTLFFFIYIKNISDKIILIFLSLFFATISILNFNTAYYSFEDNLFNLNRLDYVQNSYQTDKIFGSHTLVLRPSWVKNYDLTSLSPKDYQVIYQNRTQILPPQRMKFYALELNTNWVSVLYLLLILTFIIKKYEYVEGK